MKPATRSSSRVTTSWPSVPGRVHNTSGSPTIHWLIVVSPHGEDAKQHVEAEDQQSDQHDLHTLVGHNNEADIEPVSFRQRLGLGRIGEVLERRVGQRAMRCDLADLLPRLEAAQGFDLPWETDQHEQRANSTKQNQRRCEVQRSKVVCDLPDLGVQEQKGRKQQQQRQRPHHQVGYVHDLTTGLADRPFRHRHKTEADHPVRQRDDEDVEHDGGDRRSDLSTEHERQDRGHDDEGGELEVPDRVWPTKQRTPPQCIEPDITPMRIARPPTKASTLMRVDHSSFSALSTSRRATNNRNGTALVKTSWVAL